MESFKLSDEFIEIPEFTLIEDAGSSKLVIKQQKIVKSMVQEYPEHKLRMAKHPAALIDAMPTVSRMIITDDHPAGVIVTSQKEIMGRVIPGTESFIEPFIVADLEISNQNLIKKIKAGKVGVSPGFMCMVDKTPGILGGVEFDASQKDIIFDSLAIVKKGRCSTQDGCGIKFKDSTGELSMDNDEIKRNVSYMMGMMAEMERMLSTLPDDVKKKMMEIHDKMKGMMTSMDSEFADEQGTPLADEAGKLLPGVKANMPTEAVQLYEKTYTTAKAGACKDKTGFAAFGCPIKAAWAAVNAQFVKGKDGKWTKKTADSFSSIIDDTKGKGDNKLTEGKIKVGDREFGPIELEQVLADSRSLERERNQLKAVADTVPELTKKIADLAKELTDTQGIARIATDKIKAIADAERAPKIKAISDAAPFLKPEEVALWPDQRLADTLEMLKDKDGRDIDLSGTPAEGINRDSMLPDNPDGTFK